jgi:uncharacterized protein
MQFEELSRFNPWWTTGEVRESLLEHYHRRLYYDLWKNLTRRQSLLIWGMRRTGKTVMVYQMIGKLLRSSTKIDRKSILYFSFDEAVSSDLNDVLETYQKLVLNATFEAEEDKKGRKRRTYIFFDEIQKAKDWENKIKVYYDLYPSIKFILTGSASVALRRRSKESLSGRIMDFHLEPLSFEEFLELRGKDVNTIKKNSRLWDREITPLFYKYLKYGSFPEISNESDEVYAQNYIQSNVIERILYKDIPQEFGLKDIELLRSLIYIIARNPGSIINYSELSKDLARDQRTISNYIEYLEYGLLVKLIYNYRGSPLASARKLRKAYLGTPNLAFAFGDTNIAAVLPRLLENLVLIKTGAKFFYRNSFEVDFIIIGKSNDKLTGIEVKKSRADSRQLKLFSEHFKRKVDHTLLVTAEREEPTLRDNGEQKSSSVPMWEFLLS